MLRLFENARERKRNKEETKLLSCEGFSGGPSSSSSPYKTIKNKKSIRGEKKKGGRERRK